MDPLNDQELNQLLREWKPPNAPAYVKPPLSDASLAGRRSLSGGGWRWLLTGTIRIPVPVGAAALLLLALWMYATRPVPVPVAQPAATEQAPVVSLADFRPVDRVETRIVGEVK